MNLWDTHCHLFSEYYDDLLLVLEEAKHVGVTHYIVSGVDLASSQEVDSLALQYTPIYGVVGVHPEEVLNYRKEDLVQLKELLSHPKILGIGEIGLDYHYRKDLKEEQKRLFEEQLQLAQDLDLPVVIHSRDATEDTIEILRKYEVRGVIHSFSGSLEVARIYIKMGFCLGINGVVTFKNSKLKELLPEIFPHIILETDSPYLTPHPYRGQKNSPKYIRLIAEFIAEELGISISQVENVVDSNLRRIFDKMVDL